MRKTIAGTAAALSAAALTLGMAGVANAELYGVDDPQDTGHGSDIKAVSIKYGKANLHVTTYHENLRRDPATGSAGSIFIDTDETNQGPEYVLSAGFFEGTDYTLATTDGFGRRMWEAPVSNGDYTMRVNYRKDRVHVIISRAALGRPDQVRVAVRASGTRTDGTSRGLTDWVGERRSFTPWIQRG